MSDAIADSSHTTLHVLVAEQAALEALHQAAADSRALSWVVPKAANSGDRALLFYRPSGFLGYAELVSTPEATMFNRRQTYSASVGGIVLFESPVSLDTVAKRFSDLGWPRYPRSFTTPKTPLAQQLFDFVTASAILGWVEGGSSLLPEEVLAATTPLLEGAVVRVTVNAYERNQEARRQCIEHYRANCCICGFSFGAVYGDVADGYIHVHHLRELSDPGAQYVVDPIQDLRPVCPNCHAVLHRRSPAYTIEEVQAFLRQRART